MVFVESDHSYFVEVDGVTLNPPSLSQVLRKKGLTPEYKKDIPEHVLKAAAARGTEVHAAIANEIMGSEVTISEPAKYLYENAKKLYVEYDMKADFVETPFFNPVFDYCSTPDLVGSIKGRPAIVDFKTTVEIHPQAGFQLAGQALCFRHPEKIDLYIADLRRGTLIPFPSELFLTPAREAFQNYNDVEDAVEAFRAI